ncbi:hypothetical protein GCM10027416_17570 [Okibacterium endophyticum]
MLSDSIPGLSNSVADGPVVDEPVADDVAHSVVSGLTFGVGVTVRHPALVVSCGTYESFGVASQ